MQGAGNQKEVWATRVNPCFVRRTYQYEVQGRFESIASTKFRLWGSPSQLSESHPIYHTGLARSYPKRRRLA